LMIKEDPARFLSQGHNVLLPQFHTLTIADVGDWYDR
jgi:hypothetical protein